MYVHCACVSHCLWYSVVSVPIVCHVHRKSNTHTFCAVYIFAFPHMCALINLKDDAGFTMFSTVFFFISCPHSTSIGSALTRWWSIPLIGWMIDVSLWVWVGSITTVLSSGAQTQSSDVSPHYNGRHSSYLSALTLKCYLAIIIRIIILIVIITNLPYQYSADEDVYFHLIKQKAKLWVLLEQRETKCSKARMSATLVSLPHTVWQ